MTTEQSTVPPPNATLYKDSDEMSRMAAHRFGTVLAAARSSWVVIVANTRRQCRPLPSEPPPNRTGHTRAVGNFDANHWARCQIRRRPRQDTTEEGTGRAQPVRQRSIRVGPRA